MEAVAGVTYGSDIAVDDLTFSTNLTCFSVGKPTPSEIFEGNVLRGWSNSSNLFLVSKRETKDVCILRGRWLGQPRLGIFVGKTKEWICNK